MGFALAFGGVRAVEWYTPRPDFPYIGERAWLWICAAWLAGWLAARLAGWLAGTRRLRSVECRCAAVRHHPPAPTDALAALWRCCPPLSPHTHTTATGGVVPIVVSWFLSPLLAAIICIFFFVTIRTFVLRRQNAVKLTFYILPLLLFITLFINLLFILVSGPLGAACVCVGGGGR
jgi:hypothetical protein